MRFAGKVVIITGATKEAGGTLAARFAAEGASVAGLGRSSAQGEAIAQSIVKSGGKAVFIAADLAIESQVAEAVQRTVANFGRLDVIVNHAAATDMTCVTGEAPVTHESSAVFDQILKVNLYGPFWMAKYGLPALMKAGGGAFISISSVTAARAAPAMPAYVASKAGLEGLTRQIATDFGMYGVRANSIGLGAMRHSGNADLYVDPTLVAFRRAARMIPAPCTPDDLADLVTFLASDAAKFITGTVIPLDGGALAKYVSPPITGGSSQWVECNGLSPRVAPRG
jgi:NAD(P)-dependent dehydrogenase (short-subunit alcohol dehydrogenase family)